VDYDRICFQVNASGIRQAQLIKEIVEATSAEKYAEMCRLGRLYYDTYLSTKNFLFLLYDHLRSLI
jgi:c-di-AMP phosphodiesterase-like protein